jgi:hypothetical protein
LLKNIQLLKGCPEKNRDLPRDVKGLVRNGVEHGTPEQPGQWRIKKRGLTAQHNNQELKAKNAAFSANFSPSPRMALSLSSVSELKNNPDHGKDYRNRLRYNK